MKNHHHKCSGHSHGARKLSTKKFFWVTLLNAFITAVEIAGGILSGSLALLSDAIHNLSDTISIALSFFAWKISGKEKNMRKTYGYKRAQIIAAFINASTLIAISIFLIFEGVKRFTNPEIINSSLMIGVAAFGLFANLFSMVLLEKDSHGNMNVRSAYLHMMGDMVSSVGVLLGGIVIRFWGILWIDPLLTIGIAAYIIFESWKILKKSIDILMQSSADIDYDCLRKDIEAMDEVSNIHHVHTWLADENTVYFEAHIDMPDCMLSAVCPISKKIENLLKEKYGISYCTLQFETEYCSDKDFFKK
ncbi:MAG: cation diffusion facilitator family transporter [Elusimicrobia bacterium]|nr:cation diffusion facilitator family transporter [Elusimicrobiota bacterium]